MVHSFTAEVYKQGINPCVDVPEDVSRAFELRGYVPVQGTLNEQPIRATLVPTGGGRHRLFLNTDMRQRAGVGVEDRVEIALEFDPEPRSVPMPPEFEQALEQSPAARAAFERLPPSHQKEILSYLNWVKRPETLRKNIRKAIAKLETVGY